MCGQEKNKRTNTTKLNERKVWYESIESVLFNIETILRKITNNNEQ